MSVSYFFPPEFRSKIAANDDQMFSFDPNNLGKIIKLDKVPAVRSSSERKSKRDTKAVGDRSELEVAVKLARNGYLVSKPLADSYRYDLIIDDGVRLSPVQVETGRLTVDGGAIGVSCCSNHRHRGGTSISYRGQVDFIGAFCPQTGEVYLIPEPDIAETYMHLRVTPTVNRQKRNIRWANDYRLS